MRRTPNHGRYSKVSRRMWGDEKFLRLSSPKPCAQLLWFRLLTGPELGCIPGLYSARLSGLAEALDWQLQATRDCWDEIAGEGMAEADWRAGLVWVPKAIEHNEPESPNVVRGWRIAWQELPDSELKARAGVALAAYLNAMGPAWLEAFAEATGKASPKASEEPSDKATANQKQEQKQKQDTDKGSTLEVREVFEHWRSVRKHPRAVLDAKRTRYIRARLKEGFSVAELCRAIDNVSLSAFHCGDNADRKVYDDIVTIFRDAPQVEKFRDLVGAHGAARTPPPDPARAARLAAAAEAETQRRREALARDVPLDDADLTAARAALGGAL